MHHEQFICENVCLFKLHFRQFICKTILWKQIQGIYIVFEKSTRKQNFKKNIFLKWAHKDELSSARCSRPGERA
jgi:hypothetical protein